MLSGVQLNTKYYPDIYCTSSDVTHQDRTPSTVSPKDILSHSQNPSGPMGNAVRGLPSSSNSTCQYPDFKSNVENHIAPCRQSKVSSILGKAYPSLIVQMLSFHRSMQSLRPPSFFLTRTSALAHRLNLLLIAPISTISWRCCLTTSKR